VENELRSKLKQLFEFAMDVLKDEAYRKFMDCRERREVVEMQKDLAEGIATLTRESLNAKTAYCEPSDEFYREIEKVLAYKFFYTYPDYTLAEGITDEQLLAAKPAIEAGDVGKLEHFRKKEGDGDGLFVECEMDDAYYRQKMLVNNLGYYFYLLAHQAKRYAAREAAVCFLRNVSMFESAKKDMLLRFTAEQVEEIVRNAQDGMDELKVAADYARLQDWETFRAAEAEKLASEIKRAAEHNTENADA